MIGDAIKQQRLYMNISPQKLAEQSYPCETRKAYNEAKDEDLAVLEDYKKYLGAEAKANYENSPEAFKMLSYAEATIGEAINRIKEKVDE